MCVIGQVMLGVGNARSGKGDERGEAGGGGRATGVRGRRALMGATRRPQRVAFSNVASISLYPIRSTVLSR